MDLPICRTCNTKHRLGAMYCPALKSSGGRPEEGLKEVTLPSTAQHSLLSGRQHSVGTGLAGVLGSIPSASINSANARPTKIRDRVEGPTVKGKPRVAPCVETVPATHKREFKRPLAKDADKTISRQEPWKAEGMSRASWYRRQAEARQK